MKMWNGGKVLGTRGEGACPETGGVTNEVGDNHVDDLLGKPGGRGGTCTGDVWRGRILGLHRD